MNELLVQAFATLHLMFGLPMPTSMPLLIAATEDEMPCRKCTGAYNGGALWIRKDQPRDERWKSRLLHEARHHLQFEATGTDAIGCEDWLDRERAAYSVQILYLERTGADSLPERLVVRQLHCGATQ